MSPIRRWLGVLLVCPGCVSGGTPAEDPGVSVKVATAHTADIVLSVEAPATIYPRAQANIAARITAPIRSLGARKGDDVAQGRQLAQLENRDLLAQRAEAQAAVVDAEATLEKMSAGTLPTDVERARGEVERTRAALAEAEQIYERRQQLFDEGAIPNREVLVSQTQFEQAQADHKVATRTLELLTGRSREQDVRIARSRVAQARARLAYIEAQIAFSEIRSPFAATVTEQFLYPGDMAKPDTPIFTVMDLGVVVARGQVPQAEAGGIRKDQVCTFEAIDVHDGLPSGRVSVVNGAVDPARRTVEVWCDIPNDERAVRAGTFGTLHVEIGRAPNSVVVPLPAIQFAEGTRNGLVLVVDADRTAHVRAVKAGVTVGGQVQILEGLAAGDTVVVEGSYGLPDGTRVDPASEGAGEATTPGATVR